MLKNRTPLEIEQAIVAVAVEQPAWGQVRVSEALKRRGLSISPAGVRCVWQRHDLTSIKHRLKALEAKVAQEGILLTEAQITALEKTKADKEAHVEFDSACPGYCGAQDTFYLKINGDRETWAIKTKGFRQWLARQLYIRSGGAPNSEALKSALNIIEATARFDARVRTVHVRVGELGDKLYLDLADQQWRAVEINSNGWRVVADPPVRFRRPAGMLPLPVPERGGCIDDLRPFLNISNEADFVLLVAWILAALHDRGPYPVLVLSGEQGSAKTFRAAVLRLLTTGAPRARPARTPPTRTVRASNVSTARETTPSPAGVGTSSEPEPNARALSAVVPTTSTTSRRGC